MPTALKGGLEERRGKRKMTEFENVKALIDIIDADATDHGNMDKIKQVCTYAWLYTEFQESDDTTLASVYGEAVRRITSLYRPDAAYLDAYTNGCDEPATFEDIKVLYFAWNMSETMTFDEFMGTWETVQA